MTRLASPEFDVLLKQIAERESCFIRVHAYENESPVLSGYKVYVDGNVRRTPVRLDFLRSPHAELIPVAPGEHHIIVREFDTHKPERRETNTVLVVLQQGQTINLLFEKTSSSLALIEEP